MMIRYKPLPVEIEIDSIVNDEERVARINSYLRDLFATKGFQLLVKTLRDIELDALNAIAANTNTDVVRYNIARLHTVHSIRRCLSPPQTPDDTWQNEAEEMHEGLQ